MSLFKIALVGMGAGIAGCYVGDFAANKIAPTSKVAHYIAPAAIGSLAGIGLSAISGLGVPMWKAATLGSAAGSAAGAFAPMISNKLARPELAATDKYINVATELGSDAAVGALASLIVGFIVKA